MQSFAGEQTEVIAELRRMDGGLFSAAQVLVADATGSILLLAQNGNHKCPKELVTKFQFVNS
jgi:hypothetical protein